MKNTSIKVVLASILTLFNLISEFNILRSKKYSKYDGGGVITKLRTIG